MNIHDRNDPDIHYFNWDTDCLYYEVTAFKINYANVSSDFKSIHVNIRSYSRNGDELRTLLQRLCVEFAVIILSETWLNEGKVWLDIPGYDAYHAKREHRREHRKGVGVSLYW